MGEGTADRALHEQTTAISNYTVTVPLLKAKLFLHSDPPACGHVSCFYKGIDLCHVF
jgi:hypothetical protein